MADIQENNYHKFLETIKVPNTRKVANSLKKFGEYDYSKCTINELEKIILDTKPNSVRDITTKCYILGLFGRYMKNEQLYNMTLAINKNELWKKAKPYASKKFISYAEYGQVCHEIGIHESEHKGFYYQTLLMCIYEGIYNEDLSVIKNLRSQDVCGNIITLREDNGHVYKFEVSQELAERVIELGSYQTWERKKRNGGEFQMRITGLYPDSCFKTENYKPDSEYAFRFSYYRVLRKIAKEYLEYNLLPLQIYNSGLMHRIGLKLKENGISLEEAFADQNRNRLVGKIISDELLRCNCDTEVRNFRMTVKGHIDLFEE